MSSFNRLALVLFGFGLGAILTSQSRAQIPEKHQGHINKGLEWLKKNQGQDGSWSVGGQNPVAMTSMAGLALLMEGSTVTQGKYSQSIRKAADFLMARSCRGGNRD